MVKQRSSKLLTQVRFLSSLFVFFMSNFFLRVNSLFFKKNVIVGFSLVIASFLCYTQLNFFLNFQLINFLKISCMWFILFLFSYLLYFSFILLFKKSKYSKFTTAIIKFWKRSLTIFWCLEFFLFFLVIYLTINASQEPAFFLDQSFFIKNFEPSLKNYFFTNIYIVSIIILFKHKNSLSFVNVSLNYLLNIFGLILFLLFLFNEFSQFFFVVSYYSFLDWSFDNLNLFLDIDSSKILTLLHYLNFCVLLKFWHFFVIFLFFLFFLLNGDHKRNFSTSLQSSLIQNLYIYCILSGSMNLIWFKHFFFLPVYSNLHVSIIGTDKITFFFTFIFECIEILYSLLFFFAAAV